MTSRPSTQDKLNLRNGSVVVDVPGPPSSEPPYSTIFLKSFSFSGKGKAALLTIWHAVAFGLFLVQTIARDDGLDFVQAIVICSIGLIIYLGIILYTYRKKLVSTGDIELDLLLVSRREDYLVRMAASGMVYLLRIIVLIVTVATDPNDTRIILRNVMFLNLGVEIIYSGNSLSSLRSALSVKRKNSLRVKP
jgi:hypothetical protein